MLQIKTENRTCLRRNSASLHRPSFHSTETPPLDRLNPPCNKRALERTACFPHKSVLASGLTVHPRSSPRLLHIADQRIEKNDRKLPGAADCLRASPPHTLTGSDTHTPTHTSTHTHTLSQTKAFKHRTPLPLFVCVCGREGGPWLPWRCVSC